MIREQATISKEAKDVLLARWEGFRRLASKLPNHHILAVELFRTLKDETIAVFTVVEKGEPVKYVVTGDSRGRVSDCPAQSHEGSKGITHALEARAANEPVDPASMAYGNPPPTEPTPPGVAAVAEASLSLVFNTGEHVDV